MTEHTLSVITALATAGAAIAAVIAVWVSYFGIKETSRIATQSRGDFKLSLAADLSMKLDDRFNSAEFEKKRSEAARALLSKKNLEATEDVFDFFETVGLLTRTGAITKELAYNFFFHWVNLYWIAGQTHIQNKRTKTRTVWEDFKYLYKSVRQIEESKDPDSEDLRLSDHPTRIETLLTEEFEQSRESV
jgi:hypothetical protein